MAWNCKCDRCGTFIALADFSNGAVRRPIYRDFTPDTWETLCAAHAPSGTGHQPISSKSLDDFDLLF